MTDTKNTGGGNTPALTKDEITSIIKDVLELSSCKKYRFHKYIHKKGEWLGPSRTIDEALERIPDQWTMTDDPTYKDWRPHVVDFLGIPITDMPLNNPAVGYQTKPASEYRTSQTSGLVGKMPYGRPVWYGDHAILTMMYSADMTGELPKPKPPQTKASILKQMDDKIKAGTPVDGGDFNDIDIRGCTDMSGLFNCKAHHTKPYPWVRNFNGDISKWNVSNVTNMGKMFWECTSFNQPLDEWNVSNVTDMESMFYECTSFNQPLDEWNVSSVTNMVGMFKWCSNFNQNINDWDVSNVTNMSRMFHKCPTNPSWYKGY